MDIATPEIPQAERWSDLDRLNKERDLVGIYLSAHPLDEYAVVLEYVCNTHMAELEDKTALVGREITMGASLLPSVGASVKTAILTALPR